MVLFDQIIKNQIKQYISAGDVYDGNFEKVFLKINMF